MPILAAHITSDSTNLESDIQPEDLGARYEITGVIGKGGMGTVYKAIDKNDDSTVAIKVLNKELISNPGIVKRFEQEAAALSRLSHPNLVAVKTSGCSSTGSPYIVMEYFEGKTLSQLIQTRKHLALTEVAQITKQIAYALDYAHAFGIIHRDIKPSNILLWQEGNNFTVKVVDFGIAKAISDGVSQSSQLTQTGELFGSPAYMSPEQCLGETVDERSDIYSLGCVMYEMLTGKNPFAAGNPIQTVLKHLKNDPEPFEIEFAQLHIPHYAEQIVFKCLQKDPAQRFPTAYALEQELPRLNQVPISVITQAGAAIITMLSIMLVLGLTCYFLLYASIAARTPENIPQTAMEGSAPPAGPVVYAIKNVPAGKIVPLDALQVKMTPFGAGSTWVSSIDEAKGKYTEFGLTAGQVISKHELLP